MKKLLIGLLGLSVSLQVIASQPDISGLLISASPNPAVPGQTVVAKAVLVGTEIPTGSVQFVVDGHLTGEPVALSEGAAEAELLGLSHGPHTVSAKYVSDDSVWSIDGDLAGAVMVNRPPLIPRFGLGTMQDKPATFLALSLLQVVVDPDGDQVALANIDSVSALGAKVTRIGQTITYTPVSGCILPDSIHYEVKDSCGGVSAGRIEISVREPESNPKIVVDEGRVLVDFPVVPGKSFTVQTTTDFKQWTTLQESTGLEPTYQIQEKTPPGLSQRFYRLSLLGGLSD